MPGSGSIPESASGLSSCYKVSSYFVNFIHSVNDSLCQVYWNALWEGCYAKNIIVLPNCPGLRVARLPWAPSRASSLAGPERAGGSALERPPPRTTVMTLTPTLIKVFRFIKCKSFSLSLVF